MKKLCLLFGCAWLSIAFQRCTTPSNPGHTARTFYVSQSGNDEGPATENEPIRTIAKCNTLKLDAGDAILFKGGETFEGTFSLVVAGTASHPVRIGSYAGGPATINGGNKEAIVLKGSQFKLSGINAKGAGRKDGNTTNGISLIGAVDAIVEDVRVEGFQKSGLDLYNCRNVTVDKAYAVNNGFGGINIGGSARTESRNITIQNSVAENNPGDPTNFDNHSGNGILVGMSDTVLIDHCTATNNGWDMPRIGNGPVGIWAYESGHVTIQYCISYRNKTAKGAKDGGGFDLDGGVTNSTIQYCLSYENEGAGYGLFQYAGASPWHHNTVRYCLSIDDDTSTEGSGGIFMWNGSNDSTQLADCFVHNNVVYSSHAPAVQFEPNSLNRNFLFASNIFIGTGQVINGPASGERFYGNVWWKVSGDITFRGYDKMTSWAEATGQEILSGTIVGRQINPMLQGPFTTTLVDANQLTTLAGYTLQTGSPLINTGLDIYTRFSIPMPSNDFYGTKLPRGIKPEPGVYEVNE